MVRNHLKNPLGNKRGFTLVELMIVIVIMGILVAVAIPIYGAVIANSEKKACQANCVMIEKSAIQYMMTADKENVKDITGENSKIVDATVLATLPAEFLATFKDGFPFCPTGGTYTLVLDAGTDGRSLTSNCSDLNHKK
ncbi:MAG: prepilin-type N-terminal cleavage/methylation domain-containing protein [Oscillospiraceae bacterium]